ncbi:hypothetical protein [Roseibium sp. SCP14]|uniref:hypothetical protein n=1 Tax=Roseibium sp. SCP14 TaxID=3141375 RepID=UPI00333B2B18
MADPFKRVELLSGKVATPAQNEVKGRRSGCGRRPQKHEAGIYPKATGKTRGKILQFLFGFDQGIAVGNLSHRNKPAINLKAIVRLPEHDKDGADKDLAGRNDEESHLG